MRCLECPNLTNCADLGLDAKPGVMLCKLSGAKIAANRLDTDRPGCELRLKGEEPVNNRGKRCKRTPEIMQMWAEGRTVGQIARELGYHLPAVADVLAANGIPWPDINARWPRRKPAKPQHPAPMGASEDTRVADFDPVGDQPEEDEPQPQSPEQVLEAVDSWIKRQRDRLEQEHRVIDGLHKLVQQAYDIYGSGQETAEIAWMVKQIAERRLAMREGS